MSDHVTMTRQTLHRHGAHFVQYLYTVELRTASGGFPDPGAAPWGRTEKGIPLTYTSGTGLAEMRRLAARAGLPVVEAWKVYGPRGRR